MLKTPIYQRKAYAEYLNRNSNNLEFIENQKIIRKAYYQKNKDNINKKARAKYQNKKEAKELLEKKNSVIYIISFD
tara:strand:- start:1348 stop:1575 length:228 start_codon:yes stop_codon:yes gene_type:complete